MPCACATGSSAPRMARHKRQRRLPRRCATYRCRSRRRCWLPSRRTVPERCACFGPNKKARHGRAFLLGDARVGSFRAQHRLFLGDESHALGDLQGGVFQVVEPAVLQAVRRRRQRQPRHQVARVVVDAGGDAAHAQLQFFVVARIAVGTDPAQFTLQLGQVGDRRAGVTGQAGARGIRPHAADLVAARNSLPTDVRCSGARPPMARTTCMPERSL